MCCPLSAPPKPLIRQHSSEVISTVQSFLACPDGMVAPSSVLLCDLCAAPIAELTSQGNDVFTCLSHCLTCRTLCEGSMFFLVCFIAVLLLQVYGPWHTQRLPFVEDNRLNRGYYGSEERHKNTQRTTLVGIKIRGCNMGLEMRN